MFESRLPKELMPREKALLKYMQEKGTPVEGVKIPTNLFSPPILTYLVWRGLIERAEPRIVAYYNEEGHVLHYPHKVYQLTEKGKNFKINE